MTVRKTCKWFVVFAVMIAAGGWYALQYALDHKDRLVLEGIRQHVAERVPDWGLTIADAQLDLRGRVLLTDIAVTPDPGQPALVTIPKCFVTIDADELFEHKQVIIRDIRLVNPQVVAARDAEGHWNWTGLSLPKQSDQTPTITIEQGSLLVELAAAVGIPQTEVASRNVNLRLIPKGRRRYLIEGESTIEGAGALAFGGEVDFNTLAWRLTGRADQVDMSQGLFEKAAAFAPGMGERMAELSGRSMPRRDETITPGATNPSPADDPRLPVQTASLERPAAAGQLSLPNLGLSASVGVKFDLSSDGTQQVPDFRVLAKVMNGTVTEPLSPVPLSNLHGELLIENGRLLIDDFSASNGASRLAVNGTIEQSDEGRTVRDFEIVAEQLLIDDELRHLLPPSTQRLFDRIRPAGLFTVRGAFRGDGVSSPQVRLDEFTALDCSIMSELFAYPVTGIQGKIKQQDDKLVLELDGVASGRPVQITGTVTNPGPEAEATVYVQVNDLPIDEQFRAAIVDPKQHAARETIEMLNLTGLADFRVVLHREAGLGQPTQMGLDADVKQATLSYEKFPYTLSGVSGHVKYDPWSERVWRFTDLHGTHGETDVGGTCSYDLDQPGGGKLDLTLNAADIRFDERGARDLYRATTTASPELHQVWVELNPTAGLAQAKGIHVTWSPGTTPNVELPSIHVDGATLTPNQFPYQWTNVTGDVSWKDGRAIVKRMTAQHDQTLLTIEKPSSSAAAVFDTGPHDDGARWKLRVENAEVDRLHPDREFRQALPGDVASAVTQLNPSGPLDADLKFELAAFPQPQGGPDLVTAHWLISTDLVQDRLSVGVDLDKVTGRTEAEIVWDGIRLIADGRVDFETARALDMTLRDVHGPFTVDNNTVTVGSPSMLLRPAPGAPEPQVPPDEQLLATLYGGSVAVNAQTRIDPLDAAQTTYEARVRFRDCDLKSWAEEWQITKAGVNGVANGYLDLDGRGTSELGLRGHNCWMTITDTRLGELPAVARILTPVVSSQQRDNTAFRWVFLEFDIRDGMFDFGRNRGRDPKDTRRIVLSGDSFKMIGQGYVPFASQLDPRMHLDFYSKAPPNMFSVIPIIGRMTQSVTDNWIHVIVEGPPTDPKIRTQTEVPVDNALRQFFSALEEGFTPPRR